MFSIASTLCTVLLWIGNPCEPTRVLDLVTETVHHEMEGENWYQVRFQGRKIGSLHESRLQLPSGEYLVNRSLRFSLMRSRITQVNDRFIFSNDFPYPLLEASQETIVSHHGNRTTSRRVVPIEGETDIHQSVMSYLDTLAFHPRFIADRNRIVTRSIDFGNSASIPTVWRVNGSMNEGAAYDLTSTDGATTHSISEKGIPLHSDLPGGIDLNAVEQPLDRPWEEDEYVFDTEGINVPVDQIILEHHRLATLTLRLHATKATKNLWIPISDSHGYIRIDVRTPRPLDTNHIENNHHRAGVSQETAVTQLIHDIELDRTATYTNVKRLVDTLHERIKYEAISHPTSIADTLVRKTGDCTEFADVVDAVAAELGWNSRIRTGLAYHPPSRSFRPHSWNEIAINGQWISADASWGQLPADASHVPFPRSNTLALLAQASSMRFEVVDQQYASD